jgi:hypothetical protein
MGLLSLPAKLPLLPLLGVVRLAELLEEEAERELHDPARLRRQLEEAERMHAAGQISDSELSQIQEDTTARLTGAERR